VTRGRKSAALKPQIDAIFDARSRVLYGSMANRKRIKESGGLPFSLAEFRGWLLWVLGTKEGLVKCSYCNALLTVATLVPDHEEPLAWGKTGLHVQILAALTNLVPACASGNLRKGKMSAKGFRKLVAFMVENLEPWDQNDVFSRLATGGEGAKLMWKRQSKGGKPKVKGGLF